MEMHAPPPTSILFSQRIYTDLMNDKIWSLGGWIQPVGWKVGTLNSQEVLEVSGIDWLPNTDFEGEKNLLANVEKLNRQIYEAIYGAIYIPLFNFLNKRELTQDSPHIK